MRALLVRTGPKAHTFLGDIAEPPAEEGSVLVQTLAVGVCGTDREIIEGQYGEPPPGDDHLVLGHESLGRVVEAPEECGLWPGDLVVGIVRHPDPIPCPNCAIGEWDMCRNGLFTEHGIKQRHGFCRERFRSSPEFLVKLESRLDRVGVLMEPASVVAKAWDHVDRIGGRARWEPIRALITGAGPIGLLAAMMAHQRGLEVAVLDRVTEGPKPRLVEQLGATYYDQAMEDACRAADVVVECTGAASVVFQAMRCTPRSSIVCLTGISSGGRTLEVDIGELNRSIVLENDVIFGSVNANRKHFEKAAESLAQADLEWLEGIISRRESLDRWEAALTRQVNDVKTVIDFTL